MRVIPTRFGAVSTARPDFPSGVNLEPEGEWVGCRPEGGHPGGAGVLCLSVSKHFLRHNMQNAYTSGRGWVLGNE